MKTKLLIIVLTLFTLVECGTSSKQKDLESKLTQAQNEITMYKTINSQLQKKLGEKSTSNTELEISVAEMQKALEEMAQRKKEADNTIEQFRQLTKRFKSLIDAGDLKIKIREGRMIVELPSDVVFNSGSATLSEKGHSTVVKTARILNEFADKKFQVDGHTDNVPIKTPRFPSNWELAAARAISVVQTMTQAGLSANRLSAASYSDTSPIADNTKEETRQLNRRIEISIVPDLSQLPGAQELENMEE